MNSMFQRYAAAVIGFGFVAVSLSLGVGSAVVCLLSAGACYAAVALAQRKRVDRFTVDFMEKSRDRADRSQRRADARRAAGRGAYDYA